MNSPATCAHCWPDSSGSSAWLCSEQCQTCLSGGFTPAATGCSSSPISQRSERPPPAVTDGWSSSTPPVVAYAQAATTRGSWWPPYSPRPNRRRRTSAIEPLRRWTLGINADLRSGLRVVGRARRLRGWRWIRSTTASNAVTDRAHDAITSSTGAPVEACRRPAAAWLSAVRAANKSRCNCASFARVIAPASACPSWPRARAAASAASPTYRRRQPRPSGRLSQLGVLPGGEARMDAMIAPLGTSTCGSGLPRLDVPAIRSRTWTGPTLAPTVRTR